MYISPLEYIHLTDQIQNLKAKCLASHQQDLHNKEKLARQAERIKALEAEIANQTSKQEDNHGRILEHVSQASAKVKQEVGMSTQEQMRFIEEQVEKIKKDANLQKMKEMEKRMTEARLKNHEMVDFYQKVKTLYHSWSKKKGEVSPAELYKWVNERKIDEADCNTNLNISGISGMNMSGMKNSKNGGMKKSGMSQTLKNSGVGKQGQNKKKGKTNGVQFLPPVMESQQQSKAEFSEIIGEGSEILEQPSSVHILSDSYMPERTKGIISTGGIQQNRSESSVEGKKNLEDELPPKRMEESALPHFDI